MPEDHDVHAAYVSHISHITSFALANTVLEKEKEEEAIFELSGGGFESTVRLGKKCCFYVGSCIYAKQGKCT